MSKLAPEWVIYMKHRQQPLGDKNIIGAKIVRIRREQGLKQKDLLARLQTRGLDISTPSLSRLEGQTRAAGDREVIIIAEVLGVDVKDFMLGP